MRTTDAEWVAIQAETLAPTSLLQARMMVIEYGVVTENAVDDGTLTLSSSTDTAFLLFLYQTFPGFAGLFTSFEYTIDTAPSQPSSVSGWPEISLFEWADGAEVLPALARKQNVPMTVGTHKVTMDDFPWGVRLSADKTYVIRFEMAAAAALAGRFVDVRKMGA
jgi:hypothetical protein